MWKWKVNFKIEARANPSMAACSPNGDLLMIAGFIVVRWRSTGAPTVTTEPPDDRRRDTGGASAENLVISSGNRPVAEQSSGGSRQAPAGWLYDMVQGQENPAVSCRSRKIGIRQKSTGHRAIYVSWDVGLKRTCLWRQANLASVWSCSPVHVPFGTEYTKIYNKYYSYCMVVEVIQTIMTSANG